MDDFPYEISGSEKVKNLELDLERELKELKDEIEENEMVHGITRAVSSVPLPKGVEHFRKERQQVILRGMEVSQAHPITVQYEAMAEELDTARRSDYEAEGMPLLLHEFYTTRIQELVQSKHMHMLRWKRFNEHTGTIESLYPSYQDRLKHIMMEYNDCLQRAQRLACSRESFFANNNNSLLSIKTDDMLIYLRWLVCHFHSTKKFNQFMRVLQWLPVNRKMETSPVAKEQETDDMSTSARIPSKYQDDNFLGGPRSGTSHSRPNSAASNRSMSGAVPPTPPPVNPTIINSNPLPASQLVLALAASGGGIASDEDTLSLPLHSTDFDKLRSQLSYLAHLYGIEMDVEGIRSSADEMELYAFVSRKFRQVYTRQEHMKTYKTYDRIELGQENWGADHSMHALKQQCNWLSFVTLKPEKDPHQEKKMMELRMKKNIDELLRVQSKFIHVTDAEKIQDILREHAASTREPEFVEPVKPWSKRETESIALVWKRIYTNPELYKNEDKLDAALKEVEDKEAADRGQKSKAVSSRKRRDSYDYFDAVQLLGLDDGEQDSNDPASIQGGYLSFLQLRHLRIRDLQRTCLSIMNYFRSVERSLTINDQGLSLEAGRQKRTSPQEHRRGVSDGGMGGSGGLGSHAYMHYTPRDFKLSESEFMEFSEVENHDDFYTVEEGRVHVQDQRGYYIVYETALEDLKKLEEDLLLVATHFIEKDKEKRNPSGMTGRWNNSARRRQQTQTAGDFDIGSYGHQEVDRFAVLLDLWSSEAAYLECKREVFDCYLEAYHHVFNRDEKRNLAQVLTDVTHKRPRFDFKADYFIKNYRIECVTLRHHASLIKSILDKQIEEQREYIQKVVKEGETDFGLPHRIIQKQPIAVNMSRSALKNVYMLEFHPSLAVAAQLPGALRNAYWELYHMHRPETVTEMVVLEKKLLEFAIKDWEKMDILGSSYSLTVQKDLFAGTYIEDPKLVDEMAKTLVYKSEQDTLRKSTKDKQIGLVSSFAKILDLVTVRHRLIDSGWECEVLSKLYRKLAVSMGYDECHLFLRFVQFEFAALNEEAGKPPPVFITAVNEDDSINLDRYVPNQIYLAIHEVDESHVGRFSFRNRDGVTRLLTDGGLQSFKVVILTQLVHKNALTSAIQQISECQPVKDLDITKNTSARPGSPDTKSEKSSATAMTGMSSGTGATSLGTKLTHGAQLHKRAPEAFVSLQLEKGPSRDLMLNEFVNKKASMGSTVLKNPEQMELLKRKLISEYADRLLRRISQFSLRSQILAYYNGILRLLEDYPAIRDDYFMLGDPKEKKTSMDTADGLESDPRTLHKRPRRVLSDDGKEVLNVWFVPHYTETCVMYKRLNDEECNAALTYHLKIVGGVHDILQYLCAHSRLGSSQAVLGSNKSSFASADWGGSEGIGADLREIQRQIDHLESKTSPEQVSQLITLRRDVMFLQFDTAVRHSMRETFLARGNKQAYQAITDCMHFALNELSNAQKPAFNSVYLPVPEPLEARDPKASYFFPYRASINRNGPFPVHFWPWQQIEHNMQLCLAGIKEVDKFTANGEILGVSLLMEDVLMSGQQDKAIYGASDDDDDDEEPVEEGKSQLASTRASQTSRSRPGSGISTLDGQGQKEKKGGTKKLSKTTHPLESFKLLKNFLLLWKRLEVFKFVWAKRKLIVEGIDNPTLHKAFCKEYRKVVLYPIIQSVARRYGQGDHYEAMITDDEPIVLPRGASEVEVKTRQLIKLLESEECFMINEVRKKLAKELNLVLAERAREETALPTDLWKKPAIKESFTMNKPHIAEDFIANVMAEHDEAEGNITFKQEHLNKCMNQLASDIMAREKHNFESYSMYYENLLRVHQQLLYQREQEVKQVKDQLRTAKNNTMVEVQCQLADTSSDLLLEITALRAKIGEMREHSMHQEGIIRERIKEEYSQLVFNIFSSCFDLKKKFDEFREYLHDDVYDQISLTRREASDAMANLRARSMGISDSERENRNLMHANQVREVQNENHTLNILLMKIKALNDWKLTTERGKHDKYMTTFKKSSELSKKECQRVRMMHEKEVVLIREQMEAIRTALKTSEKERNDVKRELDKELKVKKEKQHTAQQRAQSQKQLEEARRANIDKLLEEIDDKELRLRVLSDEQDKHKRMQNLTQDKSKKEVTAVKKQLNHERNMKLDAFQRVDELQTQIYDIESGMFVSRPPTSTGTRPQTAISSAKSYRSRAQSAGSKRTGSRATTVSNWPPPVLFPVNRSITPAPDFYGASHNEEVTVKKIQRPKTVLGTVTLPRVAFVSPRSRKKYPTVGRLRSRIADQLLNEIEPPDHQETIMALAEGVLEKAY